MCNTSMADTKKNVKSDLWIRFYHLEGMPYTRNTQEKTVGGLSLPAIHRS